MNGNVCVYGPGTGLRQLQQSKAALLGLIGDVAPGVLTGTVSFTHQLPIMLTRACSPTLMRPFPELEGSQAATATLGLPGDGLSELLPFVQGRGGHAHTLGDISPLFHTRLPRESGVCRVPRQAGRQTGPGRGRKCSHTCSELLICLNDEMRQH
ncbi:unnamed protein product [Tetraodon nigroviridis]|uniref:(spotted green pufferfish) hypothetical protein n=1 Tax=Tetraodon nigroviridis TaxID=99883 RepID=Q4S645_TETNG|nr:unnamed protein product [Tetraodon nigroviridis]